jgi:hypothetical protein
LNRFSNGLPVRWLAKSNSDENIGEVLLAIVSTKPSKKYRKKKKKVSIWWVGSERIQVWVCQDPC